MQNISLIKTPLSSKTVIEIFSILALGLVIIVWFQGDYYIKNVDSFFFIDPSVQAYKSSYIWDDSNGLGSAFPSVNTVLLYHFHAILVDLFGLVNSQKILLYLLFTSSMFSFWLFSRQILYRENNLEGSFIRMFSAIFYVANPFTMSFVWWHHLFIIFLWIAFPLILLFFFRITQSKSLQQSLYYSFFLSLVLLVLAPGLNPVIITVMIVAIAILFFSLLIRRVTIKLSYLGIAILVVFLTNCWYLIPYFITIEEQLHGASAMLDASSEVQFAIQSEYSTLPNTFRLLGFHILYQKHFDDYYYEWVPFYLENSFLVFLSIAFPTLSISCLLVFRNLGNHDKNMVLTFLSLLLLGIFIQKQGAPPLEEINESLLTLPFGDIFRHAYDKFAIIVVFSFAILLLFSLRMVLSYLKNNVSKVTGAFLLAMCLAAYSYPIWTGEVIYGGGTTIPSHRVIIPTEYEEFGEFMKDVMTNQTYVRAAVLPTTFWGEAAYKWEQGIQPNTDPLLTSFVPPRISILQFKTPSEYGNRFIDKLQLSMIPYNENMTEYVKALASVGTRYIIFHRDWDDNSIRYLPPTAHYELLLEKYSMVFSQDRGLYWSFDGDDVQKINNIRLDPEVIEIEALIAIDDLHTKQAILDFNGLNVYFTDENTLFASFFTEDGYRWTSPVKVMEPELPFLFKFYYNANTSDIYFEIDHQKRDVTLYPPNTEQLQPLNFTHEDLYIGGNGVNNLVGKIYEIKVESGKQFFFSPTIDNVVSKDNRNAIPIKKIFSNDKLIVYEIINTTGIFAVDNPQAATIHSMERIDPVSWHVTVDADQPFSLSFAQAYDKEWQLTVVGNNGSVKTISPSSTEIGTMNFTIRESGTMNLILQYKNQYWIGVSLWISAITYVILIMYLIIVNSGKKNLISYFYKAIRWPSGSTR